MPRSPRPYLPGVPAHIVQRGNNRQACFFADEDYLFYLEVLAKACRRYGAQVHAYCLMTNHVHLLLTPDESDSISRVMQHLGRMYVMHVNRSYRRTGTLWEGRHKGSLVAVEEYLLACYRYIELNPVKANMVESPAEYPWSSYAANGLGEHDDLVSPHDVYRRLAVSQALRCERYRELFVSEVDDAARLNIHRALESNSPYGNDRFRLEIEAALGRAVPKQSRGRPVKSRD